MRLLALTMILLPSIAFAQQAVPVPTAPAAAPLPPPPVDPGECTVTTTVRCTGAAAPYAIEAAKPEAPVVIQAPAPPPAPTPPPQMMPPSPTTIVIDPRALRDGWRLAQSSDGSLWRERKVSTDAPVVWGTGMAFWLGSYAAAIIGGMQEGDANVFAWWPIIGAFVNTAFNNGSAQALWAVDGLAQAGGFVTFLVGLAAGPDKVERMPLTVGPATFIGGGSGVALAGHF